MMDEFINIDKVFDKVIFFSQKITGREYDGCTFKNCDFSETIFTECTFIDCDFIDCNFSMAKLPGTSLKTVKFDKSKLLGIRFDECSPFLFKVGFTDCILDYSWFTGLKMQKTEFRNSSLKGVNFSNCDLTSAVFENSNLEGAVFEATQLKGADFSHAHNVTLDPEINMMKSAKFSVESLPGLLQKYDIRIV